MKRPAILLTALALLLGGVAQPAVHADSIFNGYNDYGHAANNTGDAFCAATSFADSFRFLEKKYPQVYDNKLTGGNDNPTATRDAITGLETLAPIDDQGHKGPTTHQTVWESKVKYIQQKAPGTTVFAGEQDPTISTAGWLLGNNIKNVNPTLDFLFSELKAGEDVEVSFTWTVTTPSENPDVEEDKQTPFSHMVVLTGLDNVKGPMGYHMQYLDPNNPTQLFDAYLTPDADGKSLDFNWDNKNNAAVNGVRIFQAFAESPAPEPATLTLLGIGAAGLAGYRRRRQRAAA